MNKLSIKEATIKWMREFYVIPRSVFEKAYGSIVDYNENLDRHCKYFNEDDTINFCGMNFTAWNYDGETICLKGVLKGDSFKIYDSNDSKDKKNTITNISDVKVGKYLYLRDFLNIDDYPHYDIDYFSKILDVDYDKKTIHFEIDCVDSDYVLKTNNYTYNDDFYVLNNTIWGFGSSIDTKWALENIDKLHDLGFKVFTIDGDCDDDNFYFTYDWSDIKEFDNDLEEKWIPLYIERGLAWHDENMLKESN